MRTRLMCCHNSLACWLDSLTLCRWPVICAWHDRRIIKGCE